MAKFLVEFKGTTHYSVTVEADDEDEAAELAGAQPIPGLCAGCSGWGREFRLEIPDDPACWEVETVKERP
jgi:hypothetical protein